MQSHATSEVQAERSAETRGRILDAALSEFAAHGLAGARTEQIATSAGVNKALIYYYFESKEKLYAAALENVAERVVTGSMAAMNTGRTSGEQLVQFALNHFDRIHSQHPFQSLMQQEMMRLRQGEESALSQIIERVFQPMTQRFRELFAEARSSGEVVAVDEWQMMYAALGANVFYFLSGPVMAILTETDVFAPQALAMRRKAAIEYLGQTIFVDRAHGAEVAARVLAKTPMPESGDFKKLGMRHS